MRPIKKIYIDTRFKSSDSLSDSNFKIDLPTTLLMPDDTGFYIDDVCIPHTWYTVETGRNDKLHFNLNTVNKIATISEGNYNVSSLGVAITTAMNKALQVLSQPEQIFSSVYDPLRNGLSISLSRLS